MNQSTTPQSVAREYLNALGLSTYAFSTLERQAVWCCELISPGFVKYVGGMTDGHIAKNFQRLAATLPASAEATALGGLARKLGELVGTRNDIAHAIPGSQVGRRRPHAVPHRPPLIASRPLASPRRRATERLQPCRRLSLPQLPSRSDCLQLRTPRPGLPALPVVDRQGGDAEQTGKGRRGEPEPFPLAGKPRCAEPKLPTFTLASGLDFRFRSTRPAPHLLLERCHPLLESSDFATVSRGRFPKRVSLRFELPASNS